MSRGFGRARLAALVLAALLGLGACTQGPAGEPSDDETYVGTVETPSPGVTDPTTTASPDPELVQAAEELAASAEAQASAAVGTPIPPRDGPVLGGDISWPQCPKGMGIPHKRSLGLPLPGPEAEYVVIGLTNGPGFNANPCLESQADWARSRRLLVAAYSVLSFPDKATLAAYRGHGPFDGGTRLGALQNVGFQQARFNVESMKRVGLATPIVWMDVESVAFYDWSDSPTDNAAVVQGAAQGYLDAGYQVGVYSTPYLWEGVVGGLALGVPEWRAAGQTSMAEALSRCGADWSIQGGPAVLGQWVEGNRDRNVTCPGAELDLGRWFAQT